LNKDLISKLAWAPRDPEVSRLIFAQDKTSNNDQKLLFMQICRKPDGFKSEHKKDLGWPNAKFDKETKKAEALGLLKSEEIYFGTPGRQPEILEFTDKGRELALQFGLKIPRQMRGGVAHNLYIKRVSAYFGDEGYEMRAEYALSTPPIFIDLYGRKGETRIAIEVELSDWKHGLERIKSLLEANVMDEIWLMSDKSELVGKIKRQMKLERLVLDNVVLLTIQDFFKARRRT